MWLSKLAVILLIFGLIYSIFVANVANLIKVELKPNLAQNWNFSNDFRNLKIGNDSNHLLYFLQISDLHISKFHDLNRALDLHNFCEHTVPAINPPIIIASGDLTDSKSQNRIGSDQFEEEWIKYSESIKKCRQNSIWLDIRGNHDNFNVDGINSKNNYYRQYSVQGKKYPRSYMYQMPYNSDNYTFIAIDGCLEPGPKRPFNFVGILTNSEIDHINELIEQAKRNQTNYIIWFGHYPTSCMLSAGDNLRTIIGKNKEGLVYLCGHYHTLGGLVPNMYTLQKDGFLELELGDWKDNRMYRLLAIDHGFLSFVDIDHTSWPVVLITNPKDTNFLIPYRENLDFILDSTHIRLLVFSTSKINLVKVKLNEENWKECNNVNGPLYVTEWDPKLYSEGFHKIKVYVKDDFGREKELTQYFSFTHQTQTFSVLSRIVLMSDAQKIFQCMFGFMLVICTVPLCIIKYLHWQAIEKEHVSLQLRNYNKWIRKLWVLVSIDRIFYPLVLYAFYISVGPWAVGEIIDGDIGVVFVWGIFLKDVYLPGAFTYAYGFLQLFVFQFPITLIVANICDKKMINYYTRIQNPLKVNRTCSIILTQLPMILILSLQMLYAYLFWLSYGTFAFILGPLRTWSILLALWLWYQAISLPIEHFKDVAALWGLKNFLPNESEQIHHIQ